MLDKLEAAFKAKPQLNKPPVLLALSQIDQITPAVEWSPPYNWDVGTRPKEANAADQSETRVAAMSTTGFALISGGRSPCGGSGNWNA